MAKLVERLDKASTAYEMEISAEKTKNTSGINKEIRVNGQKLETVKYLGICRLYVVVLSIFM